MTQVKAVYYDGRTARGREVTLVFDSGGNLEISGLEHALRYTADQLRTSSRVGNAPRSIVLPDGAKCETDANDAIDALLAGRDTAAHSRFLHRLETHWPYIAVLFALTVAVVWGTIRFGIPELATRAAFALPVSASDALGRGALETLDKGLLAPSRLETTRKEALKARLEGIIGNLDQDRSFHLEFRHSSLLGPNALALPDGTIVVTDELVRLAAQEEELLSVLAHEIGHIVHRHALRSALQSSAVALLVAFAMGDVVSLTSLAAALPVMLVEAKFSRDFEQEADDYALRFLRARSIAPRHAAAILERLAAHHGESGGKLNYLSSHPATGERIRMFSAGQ